MDISKSVFDRALKAARELVHQTDLPIPIEQLAAHLGVRSISSRQMKASGLLVARSPRNLHIFTRASDPPYRQRFTIAHELGHILLANAAGEDVEEFHRGRERYTNEE